MRKVISSGGQSVSRAIGRASLDDAVTGVGAAVGARHSPPLPSSFFLSFLSFRRFLPSPSILQLSSFYFIPHIFDDDDDLRRKRSRLPASPSSFPLPRVFVYIFVILSLVLTRSFEGKWKFCSEMNVCNLCWIQFSSSLYIVYFPIIQNLCSKCSHIGVIFFFNRIIITLSSSLIREC